MKKIFYVFVLLFITGSFSAMAQGVSDHANNDLYYTLNSRCSFTFGSDYASMTIGLFYDSTENVFLDGNGSYASHSKAVIFTLGINDFNSDLNKFFTQANQPSVTLGVGHAFHMITNFNNWDELRTAKRDFMGALDRELYVGLFFTKSFITYYDTTHKSISDQSLGNYNSASILDFDKFINYGLKVDYNMYYAPWSVVALTGTLQRGYKAPFADFQNGPSQPLNSQYNVYSMNDLAGRVGANINDRVNDIRFSLSTPIFLRSLYSCVAMTDKIDQAVAGTTSSRRTFREIWGRLFVMPFVATDGWVNNRWHNELGGSVNILQTQIGGSNSKVALSEGFGMDWQTDETTHNGWSGPSYYVVGRLNIGNSPNGGRKKFIARDERPSAEKAVDEPKEKETKEKDKE